MIVQWLTPILEWFGFADIITLAVVIIAVLLFLLLLKD